MFKHFKLTLIGLLFSVICIFTTFTSAITILPISLLLETIFKAVFENSNHSKIGLSILISLSITFLFVTFIFYKNLYLKLKKK